MKVNITHTCPFCGVDHTVEVEQKDLDAYNAGGMAQDCFPYLKPSEREVIISGICDDCWNSTFGHKKKKK